MSEPIALDFVRDLLDDTLTCTARWHESPSQLWRRSAVRSFFGFVEAWSYVNRRHFVPDALRANRDRCKADESRMDAVGLLMAATDRHEVKLKENGYGGITERRLPTWPYLMANVRLLYLVLGWPESRAQAAFGDQRWKDVRTVGSIRDRLTHPKKNEDVQIGDKCCQLLLSSIGWTRDYLFTPAADGWAFP